MRAKFIVEKVEEQYGNEQVTLWAVYGGETNEEDNQFSSATPAGQLQMTISNPNAKGFFEVGKKYYLDFSLAKD